MERNEIFSWQMVQIGGQDLLPILTITDYHHLNRISPGPTPKKITPAAPGLARGRVLLTKGRIPGLRKIEHELKEIHQHENE